MNLRLSVATLRLLLFGNVRTVQFCYNGPRSNFPVSQPQNSPAHLLRSLSRKKGVAACQLPMNGRDGQGEKPIKGRDL